MTALPSGPRLTTRVARVAARTARKLAMMSAPPPAIMNSSSVPTIKSNCGKIACKWPVTPSFETKRVSPSALPDKPHSTGR